jgi:hypothetical protein
MTAIIGYSSRQGENSIGILCADDLESLSQTKVDKITKISGRFSIAITGLECVDTAINSTIAYFDQFSGSQIKINSIRELEAKLNEYLPMTFQKWINSGYFTILDDLLDVHTILIILDMADNRLYYSYLGKLLKIEENKKFKFKICPLTDGLYMFGCVAKEKLYYKRKYNEIDKDKILNYINSKYKIFKSKYPEYVGNPGALQINIKGKQPFESFSSCFNSPLDLINTCILRRQKEKEYTI